MILEYIHMHIPVHNLKNADKKHNNNLFEWVRDNGYHIIMLGDILGVSGSRRKEILIVNYDS